MSLLRHAFGDPLAAFYSRGGMAYESLHSQRDKYVRYYAAQIDYIQDFCDTRGYRVAGALFKAMLDFKKDKWRKTEYIPDFGHEVDQLLPVINYIKKLEHEDTLDKVEAMHGSVQIWLGAVICHDLGEDYNLFPEDIRNLIGYALKDVPIKKDEEGIIDDIVKTTEVLTHFRKFSEEEFKELTDFSFTPRMKSHLRKSIHNDINIIDLEGFAGDFLQHMHVEGIGTNNFQAYAYWDFKKDKMRVILTRYGRCKRDTPMEERSYGAEWNIYTHSIVAHGMYAALTKLGDRNNNLATVISAGQDIDKLDRKLDETLQLFDMLAVARILKDRHQGSPLLEASHSMSSMMGVLHTVCQLYVNQHPDMNPNGAKAIDPRNFGDFSELMNKSPIYLSRYFPQANLFYDDLGDISHPISTCLKQLRTAPDARLHYGHQSLYREIVRALDEEGGPTLKPYIYAPEDYVSFDIQAEQATPEPAIKEWLDNNP